MTEQEIETLVKEITDGWIAKHCEDSHRRMFMQGARMAIRRMLARADDKGDE